MPSNPYILDWSKLAFSEKSTLSDLHAVFIVASRDISDKRIAQLIKTYLPKGNLILGIASEEYIDGFNGQAQFKTLSHAKVQPIFHKVNSKSKKSHAYVLNYSQKDLRYILDAAKFKKVLLINGSWQYAFHTTAPFYTLHKKQIPYELNSPFIDEIEMNKYESEISKILDSVPSSFKTGNLYSDHEMLSIADETAKKSFDYCFQTGLSLGEKVKTGCYRLLLSTYNEVVPSPCYNLHYGSVREKNFSPPHDLNFYDTNHAEISLVLNALDLGINLEGKSIFINLLPCPPCARMIAKSKIKEVVYVRDHSDGYAVNLLEKSGKIVRRLVS